MIETLLQEGRGYHATQSERLAGELEAAAAVPIEARLLRQFLDLANHTIGEHLADWPRARALAERALAGRTPDPSTAPAWGRLAAARFQAGDPAGAMVAEMDYLRAAEGDVLGALIEARITLALGLLGSKRVAEASALYEAALGMAQRGEASSADRAIAVASNNLASELLETDARSPAQDGLLRRAADAALEFWKKCGTWVNEERALYLLALVDNALGEPAQALRRIDAALSLIAANGEEPVDVTFLKLARANACARLGDAEAHRRDLAEATAVAKSWEDPGLRAWFSEEEAKIHRL